MSVVSLLLLVPIYDFEVENMFGDQYTFSISNVDCHRKSFWFVTQFSILQQILMMKMNLNLEHS